MIERIKWGHLPNELPSPFIRGKGERPLRITLHSEGLKDVTEDEAEAIQLVRRFGNLPELEVIETNKSDFPQIVIRETDFKDDFYPVELVHKGITKMYTGVWPKNQLLALAEQLVAPENRNEKTINETLHLLVTAQAHKQVHGDILVTKSPLLLKMRNQQILKETNSYQPIEATHLIGLFLRSRDIFKFPAGFDTLVDFGRGNYYWVLARFYLPHMWRYFSACVLSQQSRSDDILELGEAIIRRAVRALQARDSVGMLFFVPQNNNIQDQIMYHFDYLTLMLSGALDTQARIANRVYGTHFNERTVNFRHPKFLEALLKTGAKELYGITSETKFQCLLSLLYELRNTIHGANLKTLSVQEAGSLNTQILVPQYIGQIIKKSANKLGRTKSWGITSLLSEVWIEPYSYADKLLKETIKAIDCIASATDVTKLFILGQTTPSLIDKAPDDVIFNMGKTFSFLG